MRTAHAKPQATASKMLFTWTRNASMWEYMNGNCKVAKVLIFFICSIASAHSLAMRAVIGGEMPGPLSWRMSVPIQDHTAKDRAEACTFDSSTRFCPGER